MVSMILTVTISLALVGGIACIFGYKGTHDTLETTLFGMNMVSISQRAEMTMKHLESPEK